MSTLVAFRGSSNVKAAIRQFLHACVRFGIHTGLLYTVEPTSALAEERTSPRFTFDPKADRRTGLAGQAIIVSC